MKKLEKGKKHFKSIRLYAETERELKEVAKKFGITQQQIIEDGINKIIDELKNGGNYFKELEIKKVSNG